MSGVKDARCPQFSPPSAAQLAEKIGSPTPRYAAAARSLTPNPSDRRALPVSKTEDHMLDHHIRTHAWLADLKAINAEIEANGLPSPPGSTARRRRRKLKPLWEE